ncbi:hypothetical protein [Gordonia jacobaea]|uniref:hypothetical protein n=1 Tax=Gordonia jacobaea TaxID=122202 RepID=UPI003D748C8E
MRPEQLYAIVAERFRTATEDETIRQVLEIVSVEWDTIRQRSATAEDAEACRLAMLLAVKLNLPTVPVWKARAMSRYVAIGWQEGVGALLLSEALSVLARVNDDYSAGRHLDRVRPSAEALAILDELSHFTSQPGTTIKLGPGSPSPDLVARFMHENRGFLLLVADRLPDARDSFLRALAIAESPRGRLKCELWLTATEYLQHVDEGCSVDSYSAKTLTLRTQAHELNCLDLADTASFNASEMRKRSRHLLPYAIV